MMLVLGVPVIRRYDLLARLLRTASVGMLKPDWYCIVDNGGKLEESGIVIPKPALIIKPKQNIGCSGAWNAIVERFPDELVVIANDDIALGSDSLAKMRRSIDEAAFVLGTGFSLFMQRPSVRQDVGWYDENFFPAYFEDNDYMRRLALAHVATLHIDAEATHDGSASLHVLPAAEQRAFGGHFEGLRRYYVRKWGGQPNSERFDKPFNGSPPAGWHERPVTAP
jgi:GT2 family glycosyltransferase